MKIEGDVALVLGKMIKSKHHNFINFATDEFLVEENRLKVKCIFNDFNLVNAIRSRLNQKTYQYASEIKLDYLEFNRELRELKIKRILEK